MSLRYEFRDCSPEGIDLLDHDTTLRWNLSTATMAVGINKITKDNVDDFWDRYCAIQYAYGFGTYVNLEDIQRCVGFSTNASNMTPTKFKSHLAETLLGKARHLVTHHNAK